jgi:hypothetical protein
VARGTWRSHITTVPPPPSPFCATPAPYCCSQLYCHPIAGIFTASALLAETLVFPQVVFVAVALGGMVWLSCGSPESRAISSDGVDYKLRRQVPASYLAYDPLIYSDDQVYGQHRVKIA